MAKELLIDDAVTRKLVPQFKQAADFLKKAAHANSRIVLKFDGDGDGITSGLNLLAALRSVGGKRVSNYQSPSAVYRLEEALRDLNRADGKDTVFVLLDHGANAESVESLQLLKSYGVKLVIIDHHPFHPKAKELADVFVTPMLYADAGASYVTGLLAYEVARRISPQAADEKLAWFALQADKSRFAAKKEFIEPVALDYLVFFGGVDNSLEFYEKTLEDAGKVLLCYEQATHKLEHALELARRFAEYRQCGPFECAVVRLDKCVPRKDYPSKSKLVSEFQQRTEKTHAMLISLGVGEDSVSFRVSKKALEKGFKASLLVHELKAAFGAEILSGGGHDVAASVKANPSAINTIVSESLALIGKEKKKA